MDNKIEKLLTKIHEYRLGLDKPSLDYIFNDIKQFVIEVSGEQND